MKSFLREFKKQLKHTQKSTQYWLQGHSAQYARTQNPTAAAHYPYVWHQCVTPIRQRAGLPDINANRLWNMQLAAAAIDGLELAPGQIFRFWERLPHPTAANGFRAGPMLIRGRLMNATGGGLCQISTTLFNVLLWGGLEIVERHNHSLDVHGDRRFFTLGQDATVAYGYKDLIARNSTGIPLWLRLQVFPDEQQVKASLWGAVPRPMQVQVDSQVLAKLPPPTPHGMAGWRVATQRTAISHDRADAVPEITYSTVDTYHPHVPYSATDSQDAAPVSRSGAHPL